MVAVAGVLSLGESKCCSKSLSPGVVVDDVADGRSHRSSCKDLRLHWSSVIR